MLSASAANTHNTFEICISITNNGCCAVYVS